VYVYTTVSRIKNAHDVDIKVPSDTENSRVVRIEGNSEGVASAKLELLELVDKMVGVSFINVINP